MIFISHKVDPDHQMALDFRRTLADLGVGSWIAPEDVPAGKSFAEEIPHALHKCEKILLLLTRDAMKSRHIIKEIDLAICYNKEVIPVQIGEFELTAEFQYLLSGIQIRKWNDSTREEILALMKSSARVYEIEIRQTPVQKITLIRGNFQENLDFAMKQGLLDLEKTIVAVGIDRSADLKISSTKGILRDLCKYIAENFHCDISQMQEYVDRARKEQLGHTDPEQWLEFGDCVLLKMPIPPQKEGETGGVFQLLVVANSQKDVSFSQTRDLDAVEGIDSREIVLRVFNYCLDLGEQAQTLFIGAMGTNGLSFPYEVITAEIMNAFVYAVKMGKSPKNLFFSVRNEDMEKAGVTSQSIYNYVRSVVSFF